MVKKMLERVLAAFKMEIGKNHPENENLLSELLQKTPTLQLLSNQHIGVLGNFKKLCPHVEFPALHKELFSSDNIDM